MKRKFIPYVGILLVLMACSLQNTTVKPRVSNLSDMYNPSGTHFHPTYTIYHNSISSSLLLIKIFPIELLYTGTLEAGKTLGLVTVRYQLNDITDPAGSTLADSGAMHYKFLREEADKRFTTQIMLRTQPGRRYQLMVLTKDEVRREENLSYMMVDRSSEQSSQNFLVSSSSDKIPFFQPYVIGNTPFRLEYSGVAPDTVYILYYGKEPPLPKPSFSLTREREFLEKPDSLWILPFRKDINYQLNYTGVYHFQLDTSQTEGITVFHFGDSYPKIEEAGQMIEPLVYLTSGGEYDELKNAANKKLAVDNFWLDKAGDPDNARELIRIYYNRVYFANYYFTSFKPGWKTDRGMIFIMYGPPQSVTVTPEQEKWIYYKNNFTTTVTFTFNYSRSPYTTDNYILQRAENYDAYWRTAVDSWRQGKVFLIE